MWVEDNSISVENNSSNLQESKEIKNSELEQKILDNFKYLQEDKNLEGKNRYWINLDWLDIKKHNQILKVIAKYMADNNIDYTFEHTESEIWDTDKLKKVLEFIIWREYFYKYKIDKKNINDNLNWNIITLNEKSQIIIELKKIINDLNTIKYEDFLPWDKKSLNTNKISNNDLVWKNDSEIKNFFNEKQYKIKDNIETVLGKYIKEINKIEDSKIKWAFSNLEQFPVDKYYKNLLTQLVDSIYKKEKWNWIYSDKILNLVWKYLQWVIAENRVNKKEEKVKDILKKMNDFLFYLEKIYQK